LRLTAPGLVCIFLLLVYLDLRRGLAPHLHVQLTPGCRDRQVLVPESAHEVEGLAHGSLHGQIPRVRFHRPLDRLAQLWRHLEVAVRRGHPLERLVRSLEVVVVDVELDPAQAVVEVGEDRAREEFVPQRLPPPLELAHGLGVLGTALEVVDAVPVELPLEVRLPPPRRVLPALVRQDLLRAPVRRDGQIEGLEHERALLVVGDGVAHDVARAVVHEGHHVEPLVLAQQKREDVALPHLPGLRPLESARRVLAGGLGRHPPDQPLLVQDAPDLRLAHADLLEAGEHVAHLPRAVLGMLCPQIDHGPSPEPGRPAPPLAPPPAALCGHECRGSPLLELLHPALHGRDAHTEGLGDPREWQTVVEHGLDRAHSYLQRVGLPRPGSIIVVVRRAPVFPDSPAPPRGGSLGESLFRVHLRLSFRVTVSPRWGEEVLGI
jgi:hypothetical protein